MAPPPEYDKEPKAPDKSATVVSSDDSKAVHNLFADHQNNSDSKTANASANVEVEQNNKHVEHLDDGQLKALLDEAYTYKNPKDREGKSSLFNKLLDKAEKEQEQKREAAARELSGGRAARRALRGGRRALAHSNSLQDLEQEALAAECALRRVRPAPPSVSARAIHGGSLPCDVDKSFLLGEESSARGGYLATVRCVNPPPLSERRVSASDAHDQEPGGGARRSKPAFPMTYTARATLEIGSGSVGSGRAVTTTTASNQVRTPPPRRPPRRPRRPATRTSPHWTPLTTGPPARLYTERLYNPYHQPDYYLYKRHKVSHSDEAFGKQEENLNEKSKSRKVCYPKKTMTLPTVKEEVESNQRKLLNALLLKTNRGGGSVTSTVEDVPSDKKARGLTKKKTQNKRKTNVRDHSPGKEIKSVCSDELNFWINKVNKWYEGLGTYSSDSRENTEISPIQKRNTTMILPPETDPQKDLCQLRNFPMQCESRCPKTIDIAMKSLVSPSASDFNLILPYKAKSHMQRKTKKNKVIEELIDVATHSNHIQNYGKCEQRTDDISVLNYQDSSLMQSRLKYRERVGHLAAPGVTCVNPKNVRGMTISETPVTEVFHRKREALKDDIIFNVLDAKTIEENCQSPKSNKIQSKFSNKASSKGIILLDDNDGIGLKSQPIQKKDEESCIKKYNFIQKESGKPPADKISDEFTKNVSVDERSTNVSRCEEKNKNMVYTSTTARDCSEEYSNRSKIQHTEIHYHKIAGLDILETRKSITCPNTENDALNIECIGSSDSELINKDKNNELLEIQCERNTIDTTVEDYNFNNSDVSEGHHLGFCTENLNIELKDFSDSEVPITEIKNTDLLETEGVGNSHDTTTVEANTAFDISNFEIIPNNSMSGDKEDVKKEFTDLTCSSKLYIDEEEGVELIDIKSYHQKSNASFLKYLNDQQKLFQVLEGNNNDLECIPGPSSLSSFYNISTENKFARECETSTNILKDRHELQPGKAHDDSLDDKDLKLQLVRKEDNEMGSAKYVLGVIPNNAYVFLTFPKRLHMPFNKLSLHEVETNTATADNATAKSKKKKKKAASESTGSNKTILSREEFRTLLFQNLMKSESDDKSVRHKGTSAASGRQVDSAIPFNCITSSEVVDTCNTTTSTQSMVAEETKPLQLGWGYRAVASLTAGPPPAAPRAQSAAAVAAAARSASADDSTQPRSVISSSFNGLPLARTNYGSTATTTSSDEYKKSLDENGNSLQGFSSPQSGSSHNKKPRRKKSSKNETVMTSHQIDGYKGDKDLKEVLRFIESHAAQGRAHAHKLGRAKHRDDADDKAGKKRRKDKESKPQRASSLEELSRTTLEELTHEPTEPQRRAAPHAKAERRSWGDDARDAFYFRDEAAAATAAEAPLDADFQTVTKKRKPRRRADEPEPEPEPRRPPREPTPRARRVSAPPSDRSADSNDDMDSVHSLPADAPRLAHSAPAPAPAPAHAPAPAPAPVPPPPPPPAPAPVSYADIARTRHNIPDLIESCNFYAEGEARETQEGREAREGREVASEASAPGDADGYPALEPRQPARRARDVAAKPPAPAARSRDRKEVRSEPRVPEPEPDVVADRRGCGRGRGRPPVILLDSAARPGDMDGVTFGFDINEQLLGGSTLRPRCDLVRDAVESNIATADDVIDDAELAKPSPEKAPAVDAGVTKPVVEAAAGAGAGAGVSVAAGCGALRWLPPRPPRDSHQLLQIVDYVGAAWEDVVRCGGGKVRYFSE